MRLRNKLADLRHQSLRNLIVLRIINYQQLNIFLKLDKVNNRVTSRSENKRKNKSIEN